MLSTLVTPILMYLVLVRPDNIQDDLEKPIDQVGDDDIFLQVEKFAKSMN